MYQLTQEGMAENDFEGDEFIAVGGPGFPCLFRISGSKKPLAATAIVYAGPSSGLDARAFSSIPGSCSSKGKSSES